MSLVSQGKYFERKFILNVLLAKSRNNIKNNIGKQPQKTKSCTSAYPLRLTFQRTLSIILYGAVHTTFHAEKLQIPFASKPLVQISLKNSLPDSMASFCECAFTCSCEAVYIGCTCGRLSKRVREHNPAWLNTGETEIIIGAVRSKQFVNETELFRIIYKFRCRLCRQMKSRSSSTTNAVSILLYDPPFHSPKQFVQILKLPQPIYHPRKSIQVFTELGKGCDLHAPNA